MGGRYSTTFLIAIIFHRAYLIYKRKGVIKMFCYEINANLKTDIFSENYQKNIYFLGKTVHYIENMESIDNWYFFSHNQFFRLTEFKDHIQGKIYISDEVIPDFRHKEYDGDYKKIFTLPYEKEQVIEPTGLSEENKKRISTYAKDYFQIVQRELCLLEG